MSSSVARATQHARVLAPYLQTKVKTKNISLIRLPYVYWNILLVPFSYSFGDTNLDLGWYYDA